MKNFNIEYLKGAGYVYQELFASDIPYYHKVVGQRTLWCRVSDNSVTVDDWYGPLTNTILEFFAAHRDSDITRYTKTFDYYYLTLRLNRVTGEIFNYTRDMIDDEELMNSTVELVLPIENTDLIVSEINKIYSCPTKLTS